MLPLTQRDVRQLIGERVVVSRRQSDGGVVRRCPSLAHRASVSRNSNGIFKLRAIEASWMGTKSNSRCRNTQFSLRRVALSFLPTTFPPVLSLATSLVSDPSRRLEVVAPEDPQIVAVDRTKTRTLPRIERLWQIRRKAPAFSRRVEPLYLTASSIDWTNHSD